MVQEEAKKIGIDKFLSKPVKLNELIHLLSCFFDRQTTPGQNKIPVTKPVKMYDNIKVMVAKDDMMNMLLISEVLNKKGPELIKAANGQEALELLQQHNPALIFMDINMPVMDGYTATEKIRSLPPPQKYIPVIALTADAMKEDKERCLATGMNDYISKPFRLHEIEFILKKYLKNEPVSIKPYVEKKAG